MRATHFGRIATTLAALAPALAAGAVAQATSATWRIAERPDFEVGVYGAELYRVKAVAPLPGGRLAIADAGNSRILILSANGQVVRQWGSHGSGPAEFRWLEGMWTVGDTIVVFDGPLRRLSIWTATGGFVSTVPLTSFTDRLLDVKSAFSAFQFLAISRTARHGQRRTLDRDSLDVMVIDAPSGTVRHVATRDWRYTYMHRGNRGAIKFESEFDAPFLGETEVLSIANKIAVVPRASSYVEFIGTDGSRAVRVALPVESRPFDRAAVNRHRDSLIASISKSQSRFPGDIQQVRDAFDADFPSPTNEYAPVLHTPVKVGSQIWVRVAAERAGASRWYAVDATLSRVVATVTMPSTWRVLGGTHSKLFVLKRDDLDAEHVAVHTILQ